jgi:hypothetical protein
MALEKVIRRRLLQHLVAERGYHPEQLDTEAFVDAVGDCHVPPGAHVCPALVLDLARVLHGHVAPSRLAT